MWKWLHTSCQNDWRGYRKLMEISIQWKSGPTTRLKDPRSALSFCPASSESSRSHDVLRQEPTHQHLDNQRAKRWANVTWITSKRMDITSKGMDVWISHSPNFMFDVNSPMASLWLSTTIRPPCDVHSVGVLLPRRTTEKHLMTELLLKEMRPLALLKGLPVAKRLVSSESCNVQNIFLLSKELPKWCDILHMWAWHIGWPNRKGSCNLSRLSLVAETGRTLVDHASQNHHEWLLPTTASSNQAYQHYETSKKLQPTRWT